MVSTSTLSHDRVYVHIAHDRIDVQPLDNCCDVDAIDDGLHIDGRHQRVNVNAIEHKRCDVQVVEHLVHHGRNDSRDDLVQVGTGGCPRRAAPGR